MKKYIFMAVAGMLALSSCSSDDNEQTAQDNLRQMTFTAGFGDSGETRSMISGGTPQFTGPEDKISILSTKNTNREFTYVTKDHEGCASFTGMAVDDSKFYAVYPYTEGLTLNPNTGVISGVVIPENQTLTRHNSTGDPLGWDPSAPIAYATTEGTDFELNNACALLMIDDYWRFPEIQISSGTSDGPLAGTFELNTTTGELSNTGNPQKTITVVRVGDAGQTVNIAIAPGTYSTITCRYKYNDVYYEKHKTNVTFEKGKRYVLGNTVSWKKW